MIGQTHELAAKTVACAIGGGVKRQQVELILAVGGGVGEMGEAAVGEEDGAGENLLDFVAGIDAGAHLADKFAWIADGGGVELAELAAHEVNEEARVEFGAVAGGWMSGGIDGGGNVGDDAGGIDALGDFDDELPGDEGLAEVFGDFGCEVHEWSLEIRYERKDTAPPAGRLNGK